MKLLNKDKQRIINPNNIKVRDYKSLTTGSLGGGLASANALATGKEAFTFNAAGLSNSTIDKYKLNNKANIFAYIVKGDILNSLQGPFSLGAIGKRTYLNGYKSNPLLKLMPSLYAIDKILIGIKNHSMETVIEGIK